jgi:hypothetical protein
MLVKFQDCLTPVLLNTRSLTPIMLSLNRNIGEFSSGDSDILMRVLISFPMKALVLNTRPFNPERLLLLNLLTSILAHMHTQIKCRQTTEVIINEIVDLESLQSRRNIINETFNRGVFYIILV